MTTKRDTKETEKFSKHSLKLRFMSSPRLKKSSLFNYSGDDGIDGQNGAPGKDGKDGKPGRDGKPGKWVGKGNNRRQTRGVNGTNGTQGTDGTNGKAGKKGTSGKKGKNVNCSINVDGDKIILSINGQSTQITTPAIFDSSGGEGGKGGDGGSGGSGGKGGRGGSGGSGSPSGSRGRNGTNGRSGQRGSGAYGCDGADAGNITITTDDSHLLCLLGLRCSGGAGGKGGYGQPSGTDGMSGDDGIKNMIVKGKGGNEEDDGCSLKITEVEFSFDSSLNNGNITRGSYFIIESFLIENQFNITLPAPFKIVISADSQITIEEELVTNSNIDLNGLESIQVQCEVKSQIVKDCFIGYYSLFFNAVSERVGTPIFLNDESGVLYLPVNHRVNPNNITFEDDQENELFAQNKKIWDSLRPENQMSLFLLYLLCPILEGQTVKGKKEAQYKEKLQANLEEIIFFKRELFDNYLEELSSTESKPQSLFSRVACEFLNLAPLDVKEKTMNALHFASTFDGVLEQREKEYIKNSAGMINLQDNWLEENMPEVSIEGDTKIVAKETNKYGILTLPILATGLYGLFINIFPNYICDFDSISWPDYFKVSSLVTLLFLFGSWVGRKLFFYKSCHACRSTRLSVKEGSYICLDCRTKCTSNEGTLGVYSSDCKTQKEKNIFYRAKRVLAFLLVPLYVVASVAHPIVLLFSMILTFVGKFRSSFRFVNSFKRILLFFFVIVLPAWIAINWLIING